MKLIGKNKLRRIMSQEEISVSENEKNVNYMTPKELYCFMGTAFISVTAMLGYVVFILFNMDKVCATVETFTYMLPSLSKGMRNVLEYLIGVFVFLFGGTTLITFIVSRLAILVCGIILHDKNWLKSKPE